MNSLNNARQYHCLSFILFLLQLPFYSFFLLNKLIIFIYYTSLYVTGFLPKKSMMGPLEKIGMVLIVCGLVACAITMFLLQDVAALRKKPKKIIFTPGKPHRKIIS